MPAKAMTTLKMTTPYLLYFILNVTSNKVQLSITSATTIITIDSIAALA